LLVQQRVLHHPIERLVENVEEKRQQEAHEHIVDVELHADRSGEISHQRIGDAEHT